MEYTFVQRDSTAFQQPVALECIVAMCQRGLGANATVASMQELGGGQYNNTYLIELVDTRRFVLRVAPAPERCLFWHEQELMRRERTMHALLTPINSLLPRIVYSDFTHKLIGRDYMLLNWVDGTTLNPAKAPLPLDAQESLWRQFGQLVRQISSVQGKSFGLVRSGPLFARWSLAVLDWLERTITDAYRYSLDVTALWHVLDMADQHSVLLDEIACPQLLHGDLWWFNLLVKQDEYGPFISAVLDADRGAWGDPLADWTFHLLPRRATSSEQVLFWQGYGTMIRADMGTRFRKLIYEGLHLGKILSVATRDGNTRAFERAANGLENVVEMLQRTVNERTCFPISCFS